jgi:transcriptional regulator with XRE-family HTH domain
MTTSGNWQDVAASIKRLRNEHGWTLQQLSERSGVTQATIRNAERAKDKRSRRTMADLSRALGRPKDYLSEILAGRDPEDRAEAESGEPGARAPVKLLNLLEIGRGAKLRASATAAAVRLARELSEGMTEAERVAVHQFLYEIADHVRWPDR